MGVAERYMRSGLLFLLLSTALCSTPKRCCSSIATKPALLNSTSFSLKSVHSWVYCYKMHTSAQTDSECHVLFYYHQFILFFDFLNSWNQICNDINYTLHNKCQISKQCHRIIIFDINMWIGQLLNTYIGQHFIK